MGAFGLNPVQPSSDENLEDDVFLPDALPEAEEGRTSPVIMNTEAPAPTQQDFNADVDYARRSYANIMNEAQYSGLSYFQLST